MRDRFYSYIFGHRATSYQCPSLCDMARAFSFAKPPPCTQDTVLWRAFTETELPNSNMVLTSLLISPKSSARRFGLFSTKTLQDWSAKNDVSLSEVFTSQLSCTSLTLDIDGKSIDSLLDDWKEAYPVQRILSEIMRALDHAFSKLSPWQPSRHPPAIHVWLPKEENPKKLSLRVAIHFPRNTAIRSLNHLRWYVERMSQYLEEKGKYLVKRSISLENEIFEKSNLDDIWYTLRGGKRYPFMKTIREREKVLLGGRDNSHLLICKTDGSFALENGERIRDLSAFLDDVSRVTSFLDSSIYADNRSLRLPSQSKFEDGVPVRLFVPYTHKSTIKDALLHHSHEDTEPLDGYDFFFFDDPLPIKAEPLPLEREDISLIEKRLGISLVQKRRNCYTVLDCERGKNHCFIKASEHKSKKMFLLYDEKRGEYLVSCFSSSCLEKIRQKGYKGKAMPASLFFS